jgi:hypothetical protein
MQTKLTNFKPYQSTILQLWICKQPWENAHTHYLYLCGGTQQFLLICFDYHHHNNDIFQHVLSFTFLWNSMCKKLKRTMRRHKGAPKCPSPNQRSKLDFNYKSNCHDLLESMDDSYVIDRVIYYIIKTPIFLCDLDWVLPNPNILLCKKKWRTWMWSINLGLHWMVQTHSGDLALVVVVGL